MTEMVITKVAKSKWLRRYKLFFVVGLVILSIQILVAVKFIQSKSSSDTNKWLPQNLYREADNELGGISAGKNKDSVSIDDEDIVVRTSKKLVKQVSSNFTLRVEELDFVPSCNINGKEAVSAIHRAKTQRCKQLLANITCLSLSNKLYPNKLENKCPHGDFIKGREVGCYKDEKNFRILNGYVAVKSDNSPMQCLRLCLQSGFQYAGVQYSKECFCGNDEPPATSKLPDSSCNMKCPGDIHENCGGYFAMNVYETGIKKFTPQVANSNGYNETARIVFLLTLNGRALRQVKRLIKILYHKDHYYYIHVDVRQDYLFRELLYLEKTFPNIRLTRKRFATIWGGASLLEMLLSSMTELLSNGWRWDFVLNLSESDYPVKTISKLSEFLSANRGKNFVKSHGREVQRFIQKQGLDKTFVECENRMWRVGDRILPMGIQMDGGSDWIALSRDFVNYVAKEKDELVNGLLQVYKYTLLPAESFFHTALRNSKFCNTYIDNNLHVTNWKRKLGCKCQYKHIVDWCGCSPNDFKPEDWARIQNTQSRQLFFARKFEPIINQAVILQLELWLHGLEKPSKLKENLHGYWQNCYHHHDMERPNDSLMTLAESIKRRIIEQFNTTCSEKIEKILQVNSYHYKDTYTYTLILLKTTKGLIEVAVKPISTSSVMKPAPLMQHLEFLLVSTDYDQKEQISRNFAQLLSPFSEPVLVYKFKQNSAGVNYNMTVLWIDPSGQLQDVSDLYLDESSLSSFVKANLKQPLLPGTWNCKIIYKNSLLASVKFLVIPLQYLAGNSISQPQIEFVHGHFTLGKNSEMFNKFLAKSFDRDILERVALANSKRFGSDLYDWIDALTEKFYSIEKKCFGGHLEQEFCGVGIKSCLRTNWSSLAFDPKSDIGHVNETSGMFDVW